MKSELSVLLAALLLLPLASLGADPAPAWSGGLELRLREVGINNANALDDASVSAERHFQRYRLRAWGQFQPGDSLTANARLMWEGRHYNEPDAPAAGYDTSYSGALMFDNLYVQADKVGGLPLKLKLGRQDIILGNGWLMLDGSPLDGSRTLFFDALRATWSGGHNSVDAIVLKQNPRTSLTLDGKVEDQTEQNEKGLVLYLRNKYSPDTTLDGFYFYKDNSFASGSILNGARRTNNGFTIPVAADPSDSGHVNALGGRIETQYSPTWKLRAEAAAEWGTRQVGVLASQDMRGFGFNGRATHSLGGAWNKRVHVGYEYLSGDDPDTTSRNEAFDPLWGRWPQWSELYGPYTYGAETRTGETTNLHRLNLGWVAQVHPMAELSLDYHALFADQNTKCGPGGVTCTSAPAPGLGFSTHDKFRGHLVTAWLRAKFNKNISGHLLAEYFMPGDYYVTPKDDNAYFLRAELNLTY